MHEKSALPRPPSPFLSQGSSSLSCAADHIAWTHIGLYQKELKHVADLTNKRTLQTGAQGEISVGGCRENYVARRSVSPQNLTFVGVRLVRLGNY